MTDTTNALRALVAKAVSRCTDEIIAALATAQPQPTGSNPSIQAAGCVAQPEAKPEGVDDAADAALWRKHKDSFVVLQAMLEAASPLVLNKLKAQEAARQAQGDVA